MDDVEEIPEHPQSALYTGDEFDLGESMILVPKPDEISEYLDSLDTWSFMRDIGHRIRSLTTIGLYVSFFPIEKSRYWQVIRGDEYQTSLLDIGQFWDGKRDIWDVAAEATET